MANRGHQLFVIKAEALVKLDASCLLVGSKTKMTVLRKGAAVRFGGVLLFGVC